MKRDDYINKIITEGEEDVEDVEDRFEKFMKSGLAYEKEITKDDVDIDEYEMGLEVETEHSGDDDVINHIILDHLAEVPDYYTRLAKMEDEAFAEFGESEQLEEKKRKRKKKRKKKKSLKRGFVGGYGWYGGTEGGDSDAGGDGGDGGGE